MTLERRSPRKVADRVLSLKIEPNVHAIVLNTSDDGLAFRALSPVTQSGAIQFSFVGEGQRIEASGELAWIDPTKKTGGLSFASVPEPTRERIRNWINSAPGAVFAPPTPQPQEFTLPSPDPSSAPYVRPPGLPLPQQTVGPSYIMLEDDSQYLQESRTRFLPGFVTGAIVATMVAAILFYIAYGSPMGALARLRAAISSASDPQVAQSAPPPTPAVPAPAADVLPSVPSDSPFSGSTEGSAAPAASATLAPLPSAAGDSQTNSAAVSAAATEPSATAAPIASVAGSSPPAAADLGDDDLERAQRYLSNRTPGGRAAAVPFLWAAVKKGNVAAEITLADLYARGDGVKKSCDQARVLFQAASQKGNSEASQQLARILRSGCS